MPIDPELGVFVEAIKAAGKPQIGTVSVDTLRSLFRMLTPSVEDDGLLVNEGHIPGPAGAIPIRTYRRGEKNKGVILYYHGGGWVLGTLDDVDPLARQIAAETGCTVVSVDYRLAPEHRFPAAVDDALAALNWAGLAETRRDLTGDERAPLFVMGDSAGGNLAAAISIMARDAGGPTITMQLLLYPAVDADTDAEDMRAFVPPFLEREELIWFYDQYIDPEQRGDVRFSPARVENCAGLPAALIVTAGHDLLAAQALRFGERLKEAGVPVIVQHYDDAIHGFLTFSPLPAIARRAVSELVLAIQTVLVSHHD